MGSYLAELIIALAICVGAYLILKPLQLKIERRMRNWLDSGPFGGRKGKPPIVNVHPIKPEKKSRPGSTEDKDKK